MQKTHVYCPPPLTLFSVVYSVLLRSLPYPSGERLVMLGENAGKATGISVTWINYQHWRAENHTFEDVAALGGGTDLTMTGHGEAVLTHGAVVTNNYLRLLGAHPIAGRLLTTADDGPGAPPVRGPEVGRRVLSKANASRTNRNGGSAWVCSEICSHAQWKDQRPHHQSCLLPGGGR